MIGAGALQALRSPNFALLWSAQVISGFGDRVTVFALAFVSWQLTHSALPTAAAVVISTLPIAVFGFFGGALADALGHRRTMIACDLIRMLVIGVIPVTLALGAPLAAAYALVLVAALCSATFNPARMAIVPELVPAERLGASNSMVYASDRTVEIVGTLVAGILVGLLGEVAFYVDAITFGLSAVLLLRIGIDDPPARAVSWGRLMSDIFDGLRILREHTILRANTIFSLLAQLSVPIVNGLTPVLIFREYGLGPEQLGQSEAALAAGAVAASVLYSVVFGKVRKGPMIIVGFAALGLALIAIAASPTFEITLVLFAVLGVANVIFFVPNVTLSQEVTPPGLRARVFGSRTALLHLTWLPVILMVGVLADVVSVQLLLGVAGLFTLFVAGIGSFFRSVRDAA